MGIPARSRARQRPRQEARVVGHGWYEQTPSSLAAFDIGTDVRKLQLTLPSLLQACAHISDVCQLARQANSVVGSAHATAHTTTSLAA
jgi:hypothetical protein